MATYNCYNKICVFKIHIYSTKDRYIKPTLLALINQLAYLKKKTGIKA